MKIKFLSAVLAFGATLVASATGQWTLQDRTFDLDTIYHATVGPGTTQTSVYLTGPATLHVFYATIDLTNEYIGLRAVSGTDNTAGCENISSMSNRKSTSDMHYFAGVNADFFVTKGRVGEPASNCIADDGEIYKITNNGRPHFSFGKDWVDLAKTTYTCKISDGTTTKNVLGVNRSQSTNHIVIYSRKYAANTSTSSGAAELTMKAVGSPLRFGTTKFVVTSAPVTTGGISIPQNEYVLSATGNNVDFVNNLKVGDELTLTMDLNSNGTLINDVVGQVGGQPIILDNGVIQGTEADESLLAVLHPRTAVGFNDSKTKLVILVVDGRGVSAGVTSKDLAALMQKAGCHYAMNLDGGGSSSLYIQNIGTRNKPSDGSERAVANAVFAVANCPTDNTPATIEFVNKSVTLPRYSKYTPTVYAYNKYGVLIDTDFKDYTLSCDPSFATVSADGKSISCTGTGYKALTASFGDCKTSVPVQITNAETYFRVSNAVVDQFNPYTAEVMSKTGEVEALIDNTVMTWYSDDANVATVDANGLIKAVTQGNTNIHAVLASTDIALPVTVQTPATRYKSLFGETELALTKSGLKSDATVTKTGEGFDLDFTVSSTRGTYAGIKTNANTFAIPDSLRMSINPGTAEITKIVFSYVSVDGRTKYVTFTPEFTQNTTADILFPISEIVDRTDRANFPINITGINFYLGNATKTTHKISVKSFNQVYVNIEETGGVEEVSKDNTILITPNPVNPGETVTISGAENYQIYNLAGALVTEGNGDTFTAPAATGIYIVKFGNNSQKMIVK